MFIAGEHVCCARSSGVARRSNRKGGPRRRLAVCQAVVEIEARSLEGEPGRLRTTLERFVSAGWRCVRSAADPRPATRSVGFSRAFRAAIPIPGRKPRKVADGDFSQTQSAIARSRTETGYSAAGRVPGRRCADGGSSPCIEVHQHRLHRHHQHTRHRHHPQ